ncbi:MAG TPA: hypothetical protein ENH15_05460 [Actinobacteria bacterium]|nr:hypothetical protein [Actinomycetota bacterium]
MAYVLGVVWDLGWRSETFEALDRRIAEDAYRGRGQRPLAERYGKKYSWIGFFTYAGLLEATDRHPREGRPFTEVDIDPSFPEKPPVDGEADMPSAWLLPSVESHELWVCGDSTSLPRELLVREKIGEHEGPWILVHGFVKAEDRVLGREAWAFISALVVETKCKPDLVAALEGGLRPWVARDVPSDHYTFAGEIPWHPRFAAEALAESGPEHAYREDVRTGSNDVVVEVLAHDYAWESYHSEMNRAGSARVPSRHFASRFDLLSLPQSFNQYLPDGTRASVTLSGIDGLEGNVLYLREDLLRQYVADRDILWFAFGERELRPYPPSPPQWLLDAQRQQTNAWHEVLTEVDLFQEVNPQGKKTAGKLKSTGTSVTKEVSTKKAPTPVEPRSSRRGRENP